MTGSVCRDCGTRISPDAKRCRVCWREHIEGKGNPNWKEHGPSPEDVLGGRCLIVSPEDTRESLIAKGLKPEAVDEVLAFREKLKRKKEDESEQ